MLILSLLLAVSVPAPAAALATCPAIPAALPPGLALWRDAADAPGIGRPFELVAASGAAMAEVRVSAAGRYRVALDQPGWIDLERAGTRLASVGHGHGPACSGIRKLVDFDLQPGVYRLNVTKLTGAKARVMIVPATEGVPAGEPDR